MVITYLSQRLSLYIVQNINILQSLAEQALNNFSIFNSLDVDCMARNLKTGWVIVATSGSTVDGREIKKEWLTDMAAHYSEKLYCARIWPNHQRMFGAQGKVLAVKVEPATEPDLKGEIHLMAILAPSDELVYANKSGRLIYTSIEVLKNFGNKGFFYLGGLAVTDEPASLGTAELQFSADSKDDRFYLQGAHIDISDAKPEAEKNFFSFFRKPTTEPEQDTPMTKEQFDSLLAAQKETATAIASLADLFKSLKADPAPAPTPAPAPAPTAPPAPEATEEFVSKKSFDELTETLKKLQEDFEAAKANPAPSTTPAGDDAGVEKGVIC